MEVATIVFRAHFSRIEDRAKYPKEGETLKKKKGLL